MQNHACFIALILASTFTAINQAPTLAQDIQNSEETPECTAALQDAKSRIEKGIDVRVVDIPKKDISQEYSKYPENRPISYNFSLKGSTTTSVLNSKKFLSSISTDIIKNCKSVSLVQFGEDATDNFVVFGLMENDKVKLFRFTDDSSKNKTWGYVFYPG